MDSLNTFDDFNLDELDDLDANVEAPANPVSPRIVIVLWLVAGGLLLALLPISLISKTLTQDTEAVSLQVQQAQDALSIPPTPRPEIQPLLSTLQTAQEELKALDGAAAPVSGESIYWPEIVGALRSYDARELVLTNLSQQGRQIILEGTAKDDKTVVAYAKSLESSALFSRVLIQSINLVDQPSGTVSAPVDTPAAQQPPSGTTTPTAVPGQGDRFEIDDFEAKDIILGQPQTHSFHPAYDIDRVKFLVKSGRYYRVYTTGLQPGVDTFLTVEVGGQTYFNDDVKPGTLSSEVMLQGGNGDAYAVIQVSNRGRYGPDMTYELAVEEVIPTPTPAPSATPQPTATAQVTKQPTPTATTDPRDSYEPDDTAPKPLTPGETQQHNFYPDGDVDQYYFLVKAGRRYQIETVSLAAGVDTVVSVNLAGTTYSNDDQSWGDLSSLVIVPGLPDEDVNAYATVINRGQNGPLNTYMITLKELPPPTPTLTPGFTPMAADTATPTTTPTATVTSTTEARLNRPPGLASLKHGPVRQAALEPQTVGFTIVLEIRSTSP